MWKPPTIKMCKVKSQKRLGGFLSRPKTTLKFILEIVQRIIKIHVKAFQQLKCAKIKVK
jgi:hypothetical protein